jgi:GxxExxY protein
LNGSNGLISLEQRFGSRTFDDGGARGFDEHLLMARVRLVEEELTHSVIGAFFEVYRTLGFGFLEHLYVMALERELVARGHRVDREIGVHVMYKGEQLGSQRLDMIVDDKLIVETKSTYELHKAATRQVYNYLRATKLEVGLLLHFGPEPKFYRVICRHTHSRPHDPFNPLHPDEPFGVDASRPDP